MQNSGLLGCFFRTMPGFQIGVHFVDVLMRVLAVGVYIRCPPIVGNSDVNIPKTAPCLKAFQNKATGLKDLK